MQIVMDELVNNGLPRIISVVGFRFSRLINARLAWMDGVGGIA
jgi:hypothetical protein